MVRSGRNDVRVGLTLAVHVTNIGCKCHDISHIVTRCDDLKLGRLSDAARFTGT